MSSITICTDPDNQRNTGIYGRRTGLTYLKISRADYKHDFTTHAKSVNPNFDAKNFDLDDYYVVPLFHVDAKTTDLVAPVRQARTIADSQRAAEHVLGFRAAQQSSFMGIWMQ